MSDRPYLCVHCTDYVEEADQTARMMSLCPRCCDKETRLTAHLNDEHEEQEVDPFCPLCMGRS